MSETERRLIVTRHAVSQYSLRRNDSRSLLLLEKVNWNLGKLIEEGYTRADLKDFINLYNELDREIRDCVRSALAEGRELDRKPKGFVLYRRKDNRLPEGQVFVRCDEESNYGFIIKREESEDVVMTTVTKAGVRR